MLHDKALHIPCLDAGVRAGAPTHRPLGTRDTPRRDLPPIERILQLVVVSISIRTRSNQYRLQRSPQGARRSHAQSFQNPANLSAANSV